MSTIIRRRLVVCGLAASLALVACKKKNDAAPPPTPTPPTGSAAPTGSGDSPVAPTTPPPSDPATPPASGGEPAASGAALNTLLVKHSVPEFSGTYSVTLAKLQDDATIIQFVRDCPQLTCATGAWEIEQIVHTCPTAFVATAKIPKTEVGKYRIDLTFAGPANNVSTGTIEGVQLQLLRIDHDEVDGSLTEDATDSSAHATFKAPVCPNT